jgi:hypothetical protein
MKPPIGVPRLYEGDIDVLYPGEVAHCVTDEDRASRLLPQLQQRGVVSMREQTSDDDTPPQVLQWIVEPGPGLLAALDRLQYRLIGQWVDRVRAWKEQP